MSKQLTRRTFLKTTAAAGAALALPTIIPSSALGLDGAVAPSNRIVMGFVGLGWMGGTNLDWFLPKKDAQIVGLCDVDKLHLEEARGRVNKAYGNESCAVYHNFEDLYARGDLDAVCLSLPDHWHAIPAIAAANAGLDVYGEKPFSHSLREGRAMVDALDRNGRIWQTGSWQRSGAHFRKAAELVRNGRIGKVMRAESHLWRGHSDYEGNAAKTAPETPPETLDWNRWLGPAPYVPYCPARVHKNWRWVLDTGGGTFMDWVGHMVDIAHWGLGFDSTGPIEVEGTAKFETQGVWDAATAFNYTCRYANGVEMQIGNEDFYVVWHGENGQWIKVSRSGLWANPTSVLNEVIGPDEIHLYKSDDHPQNFLDCIRSRRPTITPAETAHRSASVGHLCLAAMQTGRKLQWNPETEQVIGDEQAARLLDRACREPWRI